MIVNDNAMDMNYYWTLGKEVLLFSAYSAASTTTVCAPRMTEVGRMSLLLTY